MITFFILVTFDNSLQAMEFAQAKIESLVAYCAESDEEGKIGLFKAVDQSI